MKNQIETENYIEDCVDKFFNQVGPSIEGYNLIAISGHKGSGKNTVAGILLYLLSKDNPNFKEGMYSIYAYMKNDFRALEYANKMCHFELKKFANPLKRFVADILNVPVEKLEDREFKESELPFMTDNTLTVRDLMIHIGEKMREFHPDIWVNALFNNYKIKESDAQYSTEREVINNTVKLDKNLNINKSKIFLIKDLDNFPEYPSFIYINDEYILIKSGQQVKKVKVYYSKLETPKWIITDLRYPNELERIKKEGGITIRVNRNIPFDNIPSETSLDNYKDWDFVIENDGTIEDLFNKVKQIKEKLC